MWIDVNNELPDWGESVLVKCENMGEKDEVIVMVARMTDEWYSYFPYDQPVKPTHWCYNITLDDVNAP